VEETVARLLLSQPGVPGALRRLKTARFLAMVLAIDAAPLYADSINPFGPAAQAIVINATGTEPDGTAWTDEECRALKDQARRDETLFYVLCRDSASEGMASDGGVAAMNGISMLGARRYAPRILANRFGAEPDVPGRVLDPALPLDILPGGFTERDLERVLASSEPAFDGAVRPFSQRILLDSDAGFGPGGDSLIAARADQGISPAEMVPVPEPATWVLLGTGLAAAWRARPRHN
jgi:hypothetical protein